MSDLAEDRWYVSGKDDTVLVHRRRDLEPLPVPEGYEPTDDVNVCVKKMKYCQFRELASVMSECCGRQVHINCLKKEKRVSRNVCIECKGE